MVQLLGFALPYFQGSSNMRVRGGKIKSDHQDINSSHYLITKVVPIWLISMLLMQSIRNVLKSVFYFVNSIFYRVQSQPCGWVTNYR